MDVAVKVYLNEGSGRFFDYNSDFNSTPRLRMAAAFTLVMLEIDTMPSTGWPSWALERIYEQLNVGGDLTPAEPWTTRYRAEGNRSLSVGDVVVIGETAWGCASSGWEKVTTERLTEGVVNFNQSGAFERG